MPHTGSVAIVSVGLSRRSSIPFGVYKCKAARRARRSRAKFQTRPAAGQIVDLNPLDIRILKALQDDARLSFRELSRQTRASVPTVSAHVRRLERLGVLRGDRADVDPLQLGETAVFLIVEPAAGQTGGGGFPIGRT